MIAAMTAVIAAAIAVAIAAISGDEPRTDTYESLPVDEAAAT